MVQTYIDGHLAVEAVIDDQLMCHLYSERLHWVLLTVEIRADFAVVKVRNSRGHSN